MESKQTKIGFLFMIFLAVALFVSAEVSALELNPFANSKTFVPELKADMSDFLKEDFNSKYGVIQLSKTMLWFETDRIAEYSLTENTDQCLINCEAKGKAVLYSPGKLFDDKYFLNKKGIEVEIDSQYYIKEIETYYEDVPQYKEVCSFVETASNNTLKEPILKEPISQEVCNQEVVGYDKVEKTREVWNEYNFETLPAGNYEWKIEGKKDKIGAVDWIPTTKGKKLDEWAWWNDDWKYKRLINLTANIGNFSYLYQVNYSENMQEDYDDLRFVNSAEDTEFNFTIQSYNSTSAIVRIFSQGETEIYMYYGNPLATSGAITAGQLHFNPIAYYYLDETFGTTTYDALGNYNGTNNGATVNQEGKIGKAFDFDGTNDYIAVGTGAPMPIGNNARTLSWWGKLDSTTGGWEGFFNTGSNANGQAFQVNLADGTVSGDKKFYIRRYMNDQSSNDFTIDTGWHFYTITYDGTSTGSGLKFYVDGTDVGRASTDDVSFSTSSTAQEIGKGYYLATEYWDGDIDEVGIWDKTLTPEQIYQLYTYTAPTYTIGAEEQNEGVTITLNSPADELQSTSSTINFNATITPTDATIKNVTLYLNGEEYLDLYDTNETINYSKILSLEDGSYTWNITACWIGESLTEDCTESETRTFEIDTTPPNITVTSGNGTYPIFYEGINHTVNFTIEDDKLDSIWWEYNGTNTTISPFASGDNGSVTFPVEKDVYEFTIYANDTFGNLASEEVEWDYYVYEENRSYPNETIDTKQETISIDITSLYDLTVNLNYSGTIYPTLEQIISSNEIRYYTILNIPNVAVNTNETISWNIHSNQVNTTTTESTFLVKSLNYSFNQPRQLLNITIYDEITGDKLNNTQVEALVTYYLQNPIANKTLYEVHTNNNHTLGTNIEIDSLYTKNKFTYQLAGYQPREYLENLILVDGSITQLTLYLLSNSDGTTQLFSITEATTMTQLADVKLIAHEKVGTEYQYRDATYSDDSGSANLWLNPDKAHRITASKEGCTSKTISMYPTGVSIQNIELDCGGVIPGPSYNESEYYTEYNITVSFTPTIKEISYNADSFSTHNKTFYVKYEDQSCNVTGAEFKLIDGDTGLVLNTITSLDCEDTLSLIQNVSGKTGIIAYLLLTKSTGETLTYRIIYRITDISDLAYDGSSISRILQKLTDMDDFGLDQKTKTFIAFIVLFLILGGLSMGGVIKSEGFSMYILILAYIAGLSYLGWFGLELPTTFSNATIQATVNKYMILFLSSLIIGGIALSKAND